MEERKRFGKVRKILKDKNEKKRNKCKKEM